MNDIGLKDIRTAALNLREHIIKTPVHRWPESGALRDLCGPSNMPRETWAKLELLQVTGTFKPRGALTVMLQMNAEERSRGVVAASAGNHAIAVAYAGQALGIQAKVVVPKTINPARLAAAKRYGPEIELVDSIHAVFERAKEIEAAEGRTFVHPFEGPLTALGTATLGLEFVEQVPTLDVVVVAVGGGGLPAGVARAVKLASPNTAVIGVEPFGADSMWQSLQKGSPVTLDKVTTIADSLGAPRALPYSFSLCQKHLDEVVRVTDDELRQAMRIVFEDLKFASEPGGVAAVAAMCGPLRERLQGKRVGVILCGSNIDAQTFSRLLLP